MKARHESMRGRGLGLKIRTAPRLIFPGRPGAAKTIPLPLRGMGVGETVIRWLTPPANIRKPSGLTLVRGLTPLALPQIRRLTEIRNGNAGDSDGVKARKCARPATAQAVPAWNQPKRNRSAPKRSERLSARQPGGLREISRWRQPPVPVAAIHGSGRGAGGPPQEWSERVRFLILP